jgi:O-antigen/teichoic acid export membrane protein
MEQRLGAVAVFRSAILMTGSSYATYTIGLLAGALIARHLAPDDYGRYAYVVWLSGVLVMAGNHGLPTTGIRFVAEALGLGEPGVAHRLRHWLYRRQAASLIALLATFLVAFPWFMPAGWSAPAWIFVLVVMVSAATKALYLLEISIAKGHGAFSVEASTSVAAAVLNVAAVLTLCYIGAPLNAFLAMFAVVCIAHLVVAAAFSRPLRIGVTETEMRTDFGDRLKKHLAWTVVLTLVAAFGGSSIAVYLLNLLVDARAVGYFVIAASLSRGAIDLVASGLTSVLMPMMGHAFGSGGREKVGAILCDSLRYLQFLGLLAAGLGCFWAEAVVILLYGQAYEPAVAILRWMLLAAGIALGESAVGALLSTTDNQRLRATFAACYLVVSFVAAGVLIPLYGLAGAVIGCVASRLLLYGIGIAVLARTLAISLPWAALGRTVAAAVAAASAAALLASSMAESVGGAAAGLVAGCAYAVSLMMASRYFGVWQEKDLRMVMSLGMHHPRLLGWTRTYLDRWIAACQR